MKRRRRKEKREKHSKYTCMSTAATTIRLMGEDERGEGWSRKD